MINTNLGIELCRAYSIKGDVLTVLCKLKGAERPEQLTRSEIKDLTKLSEDFNKSVLTPKNIQDVRLEFTLGEYRVILGKFTELDITLQALDLIEDFNPTEYDRIPLMVGCIYAGLVKRMFDLPQNVAQIASDISDAIGEQVSFEDVYSVYDFFVFWKGIFTETSSPSKKDLMSKYQYRRRVQSPIRLLINRSLTVSPQKSNKITRGLKSLSFITNISVAIMCRWYSIITASLHVWWMKRRKLVQITK